MIHWDEAKYEWVTEEGFLVRKIMNMTEMCKHLPLLEGWRWLEVGEKTRSGDVLHDYRTNPVTLNGSWVQTEQHHPVRRRDLLMPSVWVDRWEVQGTSGKTYTVARKRDGSWGCSCPTWTFQKNKPRKDCQHILLKRMGLQVNETTLVSNPDNKKEFDDITEQKRAICLGE